MITSASEFVRLRHSDSAEEQARATHDEASVSTWRAVIKDYPDMRRWVAHNKSIPDEIIAELARDADPLVRSRIADKRKTPPDILRQLARDPAEEVRARVACNKKAPADVLALLASDTSEFVRSVFTT